MCSSAAVAPLPPLQSRRLHLRNNFLSSRRETRFIFFPPKIKNILVEKFPKNKTKLTLKKIEFPLYLIGTLVQCVFTTQSAVEFCGVLRWGAQF